MFQRQLSLIPIAAALTASLFPTSSVLAHGIADQVNDPSSNSGAVCGEGIGSLDGPYLYQSFTPTATSMVAVDLRLRPHDIPTDGVATSVRIRSDGPFGAILGTAAAVVPGTLSRNEDLLVHFDFEPALPITPGSVYVIEWAAVYPVESFLSWVWTYTDNYPFGQAFYCDGEPYPLSGHDFNFITYEPSAAPVANDDTASTHRGAPVVIDVAANDTDPDGDLDLTTVTITSAPSNGSAGGNGDGTVTYTPDGGFVGTDTFTYQICDIEGLCDQAEVTVEVMGGGVGPPTDPGDAVPDAPANADDHANPNACEDNPGRADEHRPDNTPPCRGG